MFKDVIFHPWDFKLLSVKTKRTFWKFLSFSPPLGHTFSSSLGCTELGFRLRCVEEPLDRIVWPWHMKVRDKHRVVKTPQFWIYLFAHTQIWYYSSQKLFSSSESISRGYSTISRISLLNCAWTNNLFDWTSSLRCWSKTWKLYLLNLSVFIY